jgi:hypothetical protein
LADVTWVGGGGMKRGRKKRENIKDKGRKRKDKEKI